jgi:hypothetical protein
MEPFTPTGTEPFSFSVGRLFHKDPAVIALLLARRHLLERQNGPRKALIASNPGGSLPLLEVFSRLTARELKQGGYQTTVLLGKGVSGEEVRKLLPEHDLFLWEGHHGTLINDWKFPEWNEPLPPSLVFLQSCLALKEHKVESLLRRGAVGVIGTSTRTYSASGGASSLAFFDALVHEDRTLGEALRQTKNFMLAYILLKEKRLGEEAKRTGANLRAAWAFTLWGDPTLKLPHPAPPVGGAKAEEREPLPPVVRHSVKGNTITLHLPRKHDPIATDRYLVPESYSNARHGGLLKTPKGSDDPKALIPLVFAEVPLPHAPAGKVPHLSSKLPSKDWVFNWDARRRCGYLLAVPRDKDREELRFVVHWTEKKMMNDE